VDLEQKRAIILAARAAARRGQPESANPFPEHSPEHAAWLNFYRMTLTDALRNDLIEAEYEASAY
jgi:hypothetical protein